MGGSVRSGKASFRNRRSKPAPLTGPGEIYGTALERAYVLESEVAKYPRIVIGDELWKYLNAVLAEFEKSTKPMAQSVTAIVRAIQKMIATDSDGKRILDYLGEFVFRNSVPAHVDEAIRPAYEFVLSEQKRLTAKGKYCLRVEMSLSSVLVAKSRRLRRCRQY